MSALAGNMHPQCHLLKALLRGFVSGVSPLVKIGVDAHKVDVWALALQQPVAALTISTEGVLARPAQGIIDCTTTAVRRTNVSQEATNRSLATGEEPILLVILTDVEACKLFQSTLCLAAC
jgi:hypothetical protein